MKDSTRVLLFFLILTSNLAYSVVELNAEYGLNMSTYGSSDQNEIETRTYSGSIAWYVFSTTAIEINYMHRKNNNTQNLSDPGTSIYVSQINSNVETKNYGIGIRQLLSSPKSSFKPMISLGYAKEISEYSTTYSIVDSGATTELSENPVEVENDSAFATLGLQIELTKSISLKGSATTIFPAFEFDKADKDLRYTAGIAIYFF